MKCGIYMILNKANGKMYIGQTTNIYGDRWGEHRRKLRGGYHVNKHLQSDWNEYGEESFDFRILLECEKSDLNMYEQYCIFELMTYDSRVGYNKNYGGSCGRHTEEIKRKISESRKGKNYWKTGEEHHMYGKMGENNPKSKPVVQIDPTTNEVIKVWGSGVDAERQGGFNCGSISLCCNGKRKTHKRFKWMFLENYEKLNLKIN